MLKRTPRSALKPASAAHDDIVERALQLIKPKPDRIEEARERVAFIIEILKQAPDHKPATAATDRLEFRAIANRLRRAVEALDYDFAPLVIFWTLEAQVGHKIKYKRADNRLRNLRRELTAYADYAEARSRATLDPKGPGANLKKLVAAGMARQALLDHGVKPTLYEDGAYYQLTAVVYEGATGIADANISRACRHMAGISKDLTDE
jgi:hypothetical protein